MMSRCNRSTECCSYTKYVSRGSAVYIGPPSAVGEMVALFVRSRWLWLTIFQHWLLSSWNALRNKHVKKHLLILTWTSGAMKSGNHKIIHHFWPIQRQSVVITSITQLELVSKDKISRYLARRKRHMFMSLQERSVLLFQISPCTRTNLRRRMKTADY